MKRAISLIIILFLIAMLAACAAPNPATSGTETPVIAGVFETPRPVATTCSGDACAATPTPTTLSPLRFILPTPGAEPVSAWRPPLYPVPWSLFQYDHFYFTRPIAADQVNWPLENYRYGGVFFSDDVVHTGVDIPADLSTPVLAAGPGIVEWAGWGFFSGVADNYSDPYGIAVVIRHDFGYSGYPLFTVYAHMQSVDVTAGEWVDTGAKLGEVGETGFTTGPHLHFEVRLGENSYYRTLNPELWIAPPQGWGVLVGQILKKNGEPISEFEYKVFALSPRRTWFMRTYGTKAIQSDPYYRENTVLGDLPAGLYLIQIQEVDAKRPSEFTLAIYPGHITFFQYKEGQGFTTELPPTPVFTPPPTPTP